MSEQLASVEFRATGVAAARMQFVVDLVKYALCSAAALGLDYGLLLLLTYRLGVNYLVASAISFCAGLCVAYVLSVVFVFDRRRKLSPLQEFIGFAAIGLAGLGLNQLLLLSFVGWAGLSVALAKPFTAVAVFLFNFLLRRSMLFRANAETQVS
jgi:putative flippase GtrA